MLLGLITSFFGKVLTVGAGLLKSAVAILGTKSLVGGVATWIAHKIFNIHEAPSYEIEQATIPETQKINDLLEKCINGYNTEAMFYDNLSQSIIKEQMYYIEENLKEINHEYPKEKIIDNYVFDILENNTESITKNLDKIYSKEISNTFSLNNNHLLEILKLNAGETKKEKITELAIKSVNNANNHLVNSLKKFISQQQNFVKEKLGSYIENKKNNYIISKKETEKILETLKTNITDKDKIKTEYQNLLNQLNFLEELL